MVKNQAFDVMESIFEPKIKFLGFSFRIRYDVPKSRNQGSGCMGTVICVANQKGGVGKTALSNNLAQKDFLVPVEYDNHP